MALPPEDFLGVRAWRLGLVEAEVKVGSARRPPLRPFLSFGKVRSLARI